MKFFRWLLLRFKKKPPQAKVFENMGQKHRIVPAFSLAGKNYYMFDDTFAVPAGRGLVALTFLEEFEQRCTRDYLKLHVRAVEKILSDPRKININALAIIHNNLKERLDLAMFPDHIYKLASITFFDESESLYGYDFAYNQRKIAEWKASGGTLDFFMNTPLRELIPSLKSQSESVQIFSQVAEEIDKLHQNDLQEILSKSP
jgi:hypothetical protein